MSYHIGFRFGWVRLFGLGLAWKDTRVYKTSTRGAVRVGCWAIERVRVR